MGTLSSQNEPSSEARTVTGQSKRR